MIEQIERNGYQFQIDLSHPMRRFKGGGKARLPATPAPAPTPESIQEGAGAAGARERQLLKKKKGRRSTILTSEGGLGNSAPAEKASLLGL